MILAFLRCVARAVLQHASRELAKNGPFPAAVPAIAEEALNGWEIIYPDVRLGHAEIEQLSVLDPLAVRQQARAIAEELAPVDIRSALQRYLECLPALVRGALTPFVGLSGQTVLPRSLDNPTELSILLPSRCPRFRPGDRPADFDGLELQEMLGIGGFGEVWKAADPAGLGAPVALKFCLDPATARNLKRENALGRLMSQARHPGFVALRRTYLDSDPPCLEYEYVDGGNLARLIRASALDSPRVRLEASLPLMRQLADTIAFAHNLPERIVHRDLKPSNILLQPSAMELVPRVTDFGIGGVAQKQLQLSTTMQTALATAVVRGAHSAFYTSEEQQAGGDVDPRDDVYSLGVIWYQLLLGNLTRGPTGSWRRSLEKTGDIPQAVLDLLDRCLTTADDRLADAGVLADKIGQLMPVPRILTNSIGMKLALIPAGRFQMGSPPAEADRCDNETLHEVEISQPFYLGMFQVTQEEYQRVMGRNPGSFSSTGSRHEAVLTLDTKRFPVENVCWNDAVEFCRALSALPEERKSERIYRLPTEAEWEYACRGGMATSPPFHFGDSFSSAQGNFNGKFPYGGASPGDFLRRPSVVGSYPANGFGLYDMHGNVWEWCQDWYGPYEETLIKDPSGPTASPEGRRVLRGGSCHVAGKYCRSAYRDRGAPSDRSLNIGFRVVCVVSNYFDQDGSRAPMYGAPSCQAPRRAGGPVA